MQAVAPCPRHRTASEARPQALSDAMLRTLLLVLSAPDFITLTALMGTRLRPYPSDSNELINNKQTPLPPPPLPRRTHL